MGIRQLSWVVPWLMDLISTVLGIFSWAVASTDLRLTLDLNSVFIRVDFPRPLCPVSKKQTKKWQAMRKKTTLTVTAYTVGSQRFTQWCHNKPKQDSIKWPCFTPNIFRSCDICLLKHCQQNVKAHQFTSYAVSDEKKGQLQWANSRTGQATATTAMPMVVFCHPLYKSPTSARAQEFGRFPCLISLAPFSQLPLSTSLIPWMWDEIQPLHCNCSLW